jgi:hypothetical protein
MIDKELHTGIYTIKVFENGELKQEDTIKNRIMNTVISQLVSPFKNGVPDLAVKYLAIGSSDTAVTDTDTQLGAETYRTPFIFEADGNLGEVVHTFILTETEGVGTIKEIGIFGGSTATSTANTGTLISRILWSREKTASEEIEFIRTDKIARG